MYYHEFCSTLSLRIANVVACCRVTNNSNHAVYCTCVICVETMAYLFGVECFGIALLLCSRPWYNQHEYMGQSCRIHVHTCSASTYRYINMFYRVRVGFVSKRTGLLGYLLRYPIWPIISIKGVFVAYRGILMISQYRYGCVGRNGNFRGVVVRVPTSQSCKLQSYKFSLSKTQW